MTDRNELVSAIRTAASGAELSRAVAGLDAYDRARADQDAASRELDLGARIAAGRLTPVPIHERHTAATDWVLDVPEPADDSYRPKMIAQASTWFSGLDAAVREDGGEFAEQARGRARTLASAFGSQAHAAEREFLQTAGYLRAQAASGLPQIDQTIDPNNAPAPTPYPTETFDNFAPEQDEFNGTEDNSHGSQISSDGAPMLQQIRQQDSSGSGFGSGPERADEHSTSMDTSDSYAEVPLGPPGQIGTAPAATDRQVGSAPTPMAGQPQDAGAERRPTVASNGYSAEDPFGYRWSTTELIHPFHARCASAHWPDEPCGGRAHVASVAVGYVMDLDKARRIDQCERIGAEEGHKAVQAAVGPADLADFHNRLARACLASDPGQEDMAVLHGFQAVVRPVLANQVTAADSGARCEGCADGHCNQCTGQNCSCTHSSKTGSRLDFRQGAQAPRQGSIAKGAPFAGYEDFDACVAANQDKDDPSAYCGEIKHQVEGAARQAKVPSPACPACHSKDVQLSRPGGQNTVTCNACGNSQPYAQTSDIMAHGAAAERCHMCGQEADGTCTSCGRPVCDDDVGTAREGERFCRSCAPAPKISGPHQLYPAERSITGASTQTQVQQTVDPNNHPTPEDDDLPEGVAFPLNPAWTQQWATGPNGPAPKGGREAKEAARMNGLPTPAAQHFGRMDALEGKAPHHKGSYPFSTKAHGAYLRAFNEIHASQAASRGDEPIGRAAYGQLTGRPDLHGHWLDSYNQARAAKDQRDSTMPMTAARSTAHQMVPDDQLSDHMQDLHGHDKTDVDGMMLDEDLENEHESDHQTGQTGTPHRHDDYGSPMLASRRAAADSGTGTDPDNQRCGDCGHRKGCDCPHQCHYGDSFAQSVRDHVKVRQGHDAARHTADTWTTPHQTTDDYAPVANSPATAPQPQSANAGPQDSDVAAGAAAGRQDAAAGQRPAFADNSSGVSPYVKAYADAYGAASGPQAPQDVPASMGGDSGQGMLGQEAQRGVQSTGIRREDLSQAVNTPWQPDDDSVERPDHDDSYRYQEGRGPSGHHDEDDDEDGHHHAVLDDPDFIKGYRFAAIWKPGGPLVTQGSACFEAGLYAGVTDRPQIQADWVSAHASRAARHPELGHRISRHQMLSVRLAGQHGLRAQGAYVQTAGVSTDLITDGPGASPDPMGGTPLNGPGTPPPMGGRDEAAAPGGAPPYQGAPPLPGGPVVPDQVMGQPQRPSQPDGPFTNTFSGDHPQNVTLAPVAPDTAAQPGYSNPDAYDGAMPDRTARLAAFRSRVQASIATMGEQQ